MKVYRIKNWNGLYENNRTRDMKFMAWVPFPNRHDGDGYTQLVDRKNGPALFGAWVAIVQVASRCEPRGTLLRDGAEGHDAASLARMTRLPASVIEEALRICSSECKWLEIIESHGGAENPQEGVAIPHPTDEERNGTERNRIERKEGNGIESAAPPATAPPVVVPEKLCTQNFLNAWERWQTYRRGRGKVKDWVRLLNDQLEFLARFEPDTAAEMLKQSMRNCWQGIFEVKPTATSAPGEKPLSIMDMKTVLQAKETEATRIKNAYYSQAALGGSWSDEKQRAAWAVLRREIKELNQKIGKMS